MFSFLLSIWKILLSSILKLTCHLWTLSISFSMSACSCRRSISVVVLFPSLVSCYVIASSAAGGYHSRLITVKYHLGEYPFLTEFRFFLAQKGTEGNNVTYSYKLWYEINEKCLGIGKRERKREIGKVWVTSPSLHTINNASNNVLISKRRRHLFGLSIILIWDALETSPATRRYIHSFLRVSTTPNLLP